MPTEASRAPRGRAWSEVRLGEIYTRMVTIEERHLSRGAESIGDFDPLHVDEDFARRSKFGKRVLYADRVIPSAGERSCWRYVWLRLPAFGSE